jgi:glycosyltransferase involved in cell wall biosynthesis
VAGPRILHVIQELRVGGAERIVASLAAAARERGVEVGVAAAPGPLAAEISAPLFPLPLLGRRAWRVPFGAAALDAALRRFRPTVVHAHNPGMAVLAGIATARGRRRPGLVSVHGVPDGDYPVTARLLRLAGLPVVACGPGVAAALGDERLRVEATIVNAVGPPPAAADRAVLEREWGLPPGLRLLVAVGRLVEAKNHALAIDAVAAVPGAALAIVGEGPLREALERRTAARGVSRRVVLAGFRSDARAIVGAADGVVFSSRSEGLPLVVLEALAAGTPIVATAVRGIREFLADGETALLVPPGDPAALADGMRRLVTDSALRDLLAARGLQLAPSNDEERMARSFFELYERLART